MKKLTQKELQIYINILETNNNRKYDKSIDKLKLELKKEFNLDISYNQLYAIFDVDLETEFLDNQLIYEKM